MPLPAVPLDTATVEIGGQPVAIRSLSRAEVVTLSDLGSDTGEAETFILAHACGITTDEAARWRDEVSADTANELLMAIARISGLASWEL